MFENETVETYLKESLRKSAFLTPEIKNIQKGTIMDHYREILKAFEVGKDVMQDKISSGIENHRKGRITLNFTTQDGTVPDGLKVRIVQKSHEFKYGANLFLLDELKSPKDNERYRDFFAETFNIATLPFYWDTLEPVQGRPRFAKDSPKIYRRPAPDLCLEYCEEKGIEPKAHCLNYASYMPDWAKGSISWEKHCLEKRFRELAERYADRIPMWEVTNETFYGPDPFKSNFYNQPDHVEWSFETADRYFPNNKLVINEMYRRIWDYNSYFKDRSVYYMQIERALRKGTPIDAIGMQYHMFFPKEKAIAETKPYYDLERLWDVLDTYSRFNLPIHLTEITIPAYSWEAEDEEIQAEIISNLYTLFFAHPAMDGLIYWNTVDGYAYGAEPGDMCRGESSYYGGLLRFDMSPKPSCQVIHDLFRKQWHTEVEKKIENGMLAFKGFYGEYEITVYAPGKTLTRTIFAGKELNNQFNIIL